MKQLSLLMLGIVTGIVANAQISFTANGTFTVPAGVTSVQIEVVGPGGTGGNNGGGGGGGGGYAKGTFTVVPGAAHAVTVGAGGSGITTSIAGLNISATAGANGTFVANPGIGGGGTGGTGSGGTVNRTGGTGGGGFWTYFGGGGAGTAGPTANGGDGGNTIIWTGVCQTPGGTGGISGGAPGGTGGKGAGFTDVNCNVTDPASNGTDYGAGGGGGNGNGGVPGTGKGGYCNITWCTPLAAPTGSETQTVCGAGTLADLTATGTGIIWYAGPTGGSPLPLTTALVNGTHYYAAQSSGSCESSSRLDVLVSVVTIDITTTLSQHTITATATGVTYKWINCAGNTIISGATSQSYTATQNGSYAVILTKGVCVDTSACVTVSGIVGINNTVKEKHFTIFPNPASDVIVVKVDPVLAGAEYVITDQAGRVVKTGKLAAGTTSINIATFAKGMYMFKTGQEEYQSFKVIKK
jgi:hypothetical protein